MKKIVKRTARYGVIGARRVVMKHPRLKDSIKRIVLAQVGAKKDLVGYNHWLANNFPDFIEQMKLKELSDALQYHPLISIVVPTYNTDIDFLRECLDSVRAQIYQNWELCIVDDASPNQIVRDEIMAYAKQDERINYKFLKTNQHISGATNGAVKLATGEFISLLDHDDILWPNALYEVVKALNADPKLDFLYTDEDKITEDRHEHLGPFFKPDWNPDFLHSVNYITHFTTIRKSVYEAVGGLRKEYNGAQDWDLFMRITSMTDKVYHIPKIVYSWRIHDLSTAKNTDAKPYVVAAQKQALTDDVIRRGHKNAVIEQDKKHTGYWHVSYAVEGEPLVSIVIPSKNQYKIVKRCVESIYAKTSYKNFEIILVDTGSTDQKVHRWYKAMIKSHTNFKLVDWPEQPFSYSRSWNRGAEVAQGEFVVMLNNDTEVLTHNWIELMLGDAQRPEIGAVGCLLFFPDGYHIQHAGVGVGLGGAAANSFSMMTLDRPMSQTQHLMLNTKHNMTAVTAACLMMRKQLFTDIEGFDDKLRVTYNDVDLCLRLYDAGYQNVYTPYVRLLHHESISVGLPEEIKKRDTTEFKAAQNLFKKRWAKYIKHDPNVNPNLSKDNAFYDLD
jgi:GT2 family glycosyltransferase